jgi:hypothetical protein
MIPNGIVYDFSRSLHKLEWNHYTMRSPAGYKYGDLYYYALPCDPPIPNANALPLSDPRLVTNPSILSSHCSPKRVTAEVAQLQIITYPMNCRANPNSPSVDVAGSTARGSSLGATADISPQAIS